MRYTEHVVTISAWVAITWRAIIIAEGLRVSSRAVTLQKRLPMSVKLQTWLGIIVEVLAWAWVTR